MILWKNGVLHTLENELKTYQHMATDKGLIVGFDEDIKDLAFDLEIDLKGNHLYPGFVDSHLHLIGYGQRLSLHTLEGLEDKKDILKKIKKEINKTDFFFQGYKPAHITKFDLNEIRNDQPIILRHRDNHSITVNDFVLNALNEISPTGFLTEEKSDRIIRHYMKKDDNTLKMMLKKGLESLHQFGITGGHSDDLSYYNGYHETLDIFKDVLKEIPFRAHLLIHHRVINDFIKADTSWLDQNEYLQLGAVKIFYDGTFTSKTALLYENYKNESEQGLRIFKKEELETLLIHLRKHDLPVAVHVIGDLGLDEVLSLIEKYPVKKGLHDRIIHSSLASLDTINRMKKLPIILDIQPQFITADLPEILDIFSVKPQYIYPFKTYLDNDLVVCGSSDAPIEIPNPLLGMHAAITRELKDQTIFQASERLSRYEALKLFTTYANVPTYKTNRGSLKVGNIADFTVLSKDLLEMNIDDFLTTKIEMTVVNENIVYKR